MLQVHCYSYHGLRVHSDLHLPEWTGFAAPENFGNPDVTISLSENPALAVVPSPSPFGGDYRLFVRSVGWFQILDGQRIIVTPVEGGSLRGVRLYLMGSAWAALLYQRRMLPLHGSAVRTSLGTAVFCGQRGNGKSTLAAFFCSGGATLISDDVCCVHLPDKGDPLAYRSTPRVKLSGDAADHLGWHEIDAEPVFRTPKSFYSMSGALDNSYPVSNFYLLSWGDLSVTRLRGFAALHRFLAAAAWRGDLLMEAGDPADYVRQCAELVSRCAIWEFRRPRTWIALESAATLLSEHMGLEHNNLTAL